MGQDEFSRGAKYMRDNVLAHIIGLQNGLGNKRNDPGYVALQKLSDCIVENYGDLFSEFKSNGAAKG